MAEEKRDINTGGGDYAEGMVDKRQGVFGETIYLDRCRVLETPRCLLPLSSDYIPRPGKEKELLDKLTDPQGPPLLFLHGPSGVGKSSLAAEVIHRHSKTVFAGGVLAASLRNSSPSELWFHFLRLLDPYWQVTDRDSVVLRDVVWQQLMQVEKRLLLVFDDVHNEQQLVQLLPSDQNNYGHCCVLIISTVEFTLTTALASSGRMYLTGFETSEAETFFSRAIGADTVAHYREHLRTICERLEYNPLKLKSVTRTLTRHALSPHEYLMRIAAQIEDQKTDDTIPLSLQQTVEDLSAAQQELFALTSVLGSGDWTEAMLAAVVLCPVTDMLNDLHELVECGLVNRRSNSRYHMNAVVHALAHQRFGQFDMRRQQTSAMLLLRYCLDVAQDAWTTILAQPTLPVEAGAPIRHNSVQFVQRFRDTLLPEQSHFRKALDWAARQQHWNLLQRFSFLSAMELLSYLVANGGEIQLSMCLATLVEPVIWPSEEDSFFAYQSLITAGEFHYQKPDVVHTTIESGYRDSRETRCELIWEITAGTIVDGIIRSARLIYSRWLGIRATHLVCRDVDIVGGKFLGCDFSNSIWTNCDARHVAFNGTTFSHSLICCTELHGADLQHATFAYSVLENVKLRSANLQMADFTGALLRHLDLRDADLRGAVFAYAKFEDVDVRGCNLQGVDWTGVEGITRNEVCFDEGLSDSIMRLLAGATVQKPATKRRLRPASVNDVASKADLSGWDLRALCFDERVLATPVSADNWKEPAIPLCNSDLRSATFRNARLQGCSICFADLRDIDLRAADLYRADLRSADLRGALLIETNFEHACLDKAVLRATRLHQAKLHKASCVDASFRGAVLTNANLQHAVLTGADLSYVTAHNVHFDSAKLDHALLIDADLAGSRFQDATLYGAVCTRTNFSRTNIRDEQLAQAECLRGATLPDAHTPAVIDGDHIKGLLLPAFLRFSEWVNTFSKFELHEQDLFGARFYGIFSKVTFTSVNLTRSRLQGIYSKTIFIHTTLAHAHLKGIFSHVELKDVCCAATSFVGASLVHCDLTGTYNLSEAQLQQAHRLRGTKMPDGTRYTGQFELAGDIEDAVRKGIDPRDHTAMLRDFYKIN
jgi:uncharacterized protein YjbI with pentapeptide repeats